MNEPDGRTAAGATLERRPVVVCVDDERPVLSALHRVLRREPYHVIVTDDPETALDFLSRFQVRLILCDQRMPRMAGTDLLKIVQERSPETIRVMLTGYPDTATILGRVQQRIRRLITKPWDDQDLRQTLHNLLQEPESEEERTEAGGAPPAGADFMERLIHIDCGGKSVRGVMEEIRSRTESGAAPPGIVLLLEDLRSLGDSVSSFLGQLVEWASPMQVPLSIADRSGFTTEILEVSGEKVPITVYAPRRRNRPHGRILSVEDRDSTRTLLRVLIESAGFYCCSVGSAAEAVARLGREDFDAVLLDLDLRNGDPLAVADGLHRLQRQEPVIAVSAEPERWDTASLRRHGIRRLLAKPVRVAEVLGAIEGLDA